MEGLNFMNSELNYFLQTASNGVSLGSMYSMIAVGYSMVYSLLYQINFAHGDLYVFGTFIAFTFMAMSLPIPLAIVVAGLLTACVGMTIERTVYRPVRFANRIVPMISALGAALVLRTLAQVIWGPEAIAFPMFLPQGAIELGGFRLFTKNLIVLGFATILVVGLTYIMNHTKIGRATQCIVENMTTAQLMGIPINKIIPLIYGLGGFFGVVGGIMYSGYYGIISIDMGIWGTIKAWAAAMLGGVGSFYGAFLGGILLGVAETFAGAYVSSAFKEALGYIVIVLVLVFRPNGLLGKKKVVKV